MAALENWCEYVSQDGEVRNLLQVFCECEDLDEAFTSLVSSQQNGSPGRPGTAWERVLATAQDRSRVPWPGGARRVDLAWLIATALLWAVHRRARQSTTVIGVLLTLAVCFAGLVFAHVRALRHRSNSQFHMAWLSLSVLWSYCRYLADVNPSMPWTTKVMAHSALAVMVACFLHCCAADPGRDWASEDPNLQPDDCRKRSGLLRSGRCSICRCTFRLRDHHCVWVGQCIAERNRRTFLMFLVSFSALSTWFAVKMILLHAGDEPLCRQELSGQRWLHAVFCVLRHNLAGERVFHALYAFFSGVLAAALVVQQCILIGAGLTSLELRRMGHISAGSNDTARGPPPAQQHEDGSSDRGSDSTPERSRYVMAPAFRMFPPIREVVRNWASFLAGTQLPKALLETETLSVKGERGNVGTIDSDKTALLIKVSTERKNVEKRDGHMIAEGGRGRGIQSGGQEASPRRRRR